MAGRFCPWKLSDGAGKIPSAHSAVEAAEAVEAEEEAVAVAEAEEEAVETVESELVDEAKRCDDAVAHRIRTSPGVSMTFRCRSVFKFKCTFGSGFGNPTRSTISMNSTRMAHAASIVDCAVAGSSKIAVSASKPAASVGAAGAVAPRERADASKERTSPAVARFIFLGDLGDFTFWLLVLRYKYAYCACFFEKKMFFLVCTEDPLHRRGSKKLYLALDLKRKKKKKKKEKSQKKEPTREMLAAAAIARRGEKRGSRPRSERKAPPGEPRVGSKTREPTIAPVRGLRDHTSGDYSDSGIGSSESSSKGGPFAPIGNYGSGAGSSRGSFHDGFTPKADTRRMPYIPYQDSAGVTELGVGGAAKTAQLAQLRSDRIHGGSSAYADTSRLLDVPERGGVGGASGSVGSGSAGSGLTDAPPASDSTPPALYAVNGDTVDRAGSHSINRGPPSQVPPSNVDAYVIVRSASNACWSMVYSYVVTISRPVVNNPQFEYTLANWDPSKEGAYANPTRLVFCVEGESDIMTVHRKLVDLGTEGLNKLNIKMIQYLYTSQNVKAQYVIPPGLFDETHNEKVVEGHTTLGGIYISTPAPRTGPDYKLSLVSHDVKGLDDHIRAHRALQIFKSHLDNSSEGKGKNMRLVVAQYDNIYNSLNTPKDSGALVIVITRKRIMEKGGGNTTVEKYNDEVNLVRKWADSVTGGFMLVDSNTYGSAHVSVEIDGRTVQIQLNTLLPVSTVLGADKVPRGIARGGYTDQRALLDHDAVMPLLELNSSEMRALNGDSLARREISARVMLHQAQEDAELVRAVENLANGPGIGKAAAMQPDACIELFNKELKTHLEVLHQSAARSKSAFNQQVAAFLKEQEPNSAESVREAATGYCNNGTLITDQSVREVAFDYHQARLDRATKFVREAQNVVHYEKYKSALDSLVKSNADNGLISYLKTELHANRAASPDGDREYALSGNPEEKASEKFKELKNAALQKQREAAESIEKSVVDGILDSETKPKQGRSSAKKEVEQDTQVPVVQWLHELKNGVRELIETELRERRITDAQKATMDSLVDKIGANMDTNRKMSQLRDAAGHTNRVYDKLKREADRQIHEASEKENEELRARTQMVEILENEAKRQIEADGSTGVITERAVQEAENTVVERAKSLLSSSGGWFGNQVGRLVETGRRLVSEKGAAGMQSLLSRASFVTPRVAEMVSKAAEDPNVKSVVEGFVSTKDKTVTDLRELAKSAEKFAAGKLGPLAAHAFVEGAHSAVNERAGNLAERVANPPNPPLIPLDALGELATEVVAFDALNPSDAQPAVASQATQEAVRVLIRDAANQENIPKLIGCLTLAQALGATGNGDTSVRPVIVLTSLFSQKILDSYQRNQRGLYPTIPRGIPRGSREPMGIMKLNITRGSREPIGIITRPRNQHKLQPNATGQGLEILLDLLLDVLTHSGEVMVSSNRVGFCGTEAEDNKSDILKALGVPNARVMYVKGDSSKPLPALGTDMLFDHIVIGRTCAYNNTADTAATCFMAYLYHVTESISVVARNDEEAEWIKWVVCSTLTNILPELIESRSLQSGTLLTMRRMQVMSSHRVPESMSVLRKELGIVVTRPRAPLMIGDATLSDATRAAVASAVEKLVKDVSAAARSGGLIEAAALTETAPTPKPRGDEGHEVFPDKCGEVFKAEIKRLVDERKQKKRYKHKAQLVSAIVSQVNYDDICNTITEQKGGRSQKVTRGDVYKLASAHLILCEQKANTFIARLRKSLEKQNLETQKEYKNTGAIDMVEMDRVVDQAVETVVAKIEEGRREPDNDAKPQETKGVLGFRRFVPSFSSLSSFLGGGGPRFGSDPQTAMQRFV